MWLLVPIQGKIKEFFADFDQFPYQTGSSLNASGINYGMLRQQDAMKRLKDLEGHAAALGFPSVGDGCRGGGPFILRRRAWHEAMTSSPFAVAGFLLVILLRLP